MQASMAAACDTRVTTRVAHAGVTVASHDVRKMTAARVSHLQVAADGHLAPAPATPSPCNEDHR